MHLSKIYEAMTGYVPGVMETTREHAVLLPLTKQAGELCLVYERRAEGIVQAGEVCFPGGGIASGETPQECALREFSEEVGLPESAVNLIGRFDTQVTYGHLAVHTFIGELEAGALDFAEPDPAEVARVFTIPLSFLMESEPKLYRFPLKVEVIDESIYDYVGLSEREYNWLRGYVDLPVWKYDGEVLWGISARITRSFLNFLKTKAK